jgi:hypothetical protein
MKKQTQEFNNFDAAMRKLIQVPHEKLKAELEAEKLAKLKKRKVKPSASDRASRERD